MESCNFCLREGSVTEYRVENMDPTEIQAQLQETRAQVDQLTALVGQLQQGVMADVP